MHELSLCRSLIKLLQQQAEQQGFSRVCTIWLDVGPMAGVVPEALEFAFSACSPGTLAEGATLHLVPSQATARCRDCGQISNPSSRLDPCPHCGHAAVDLISGDNLTIKELEVE